LLQFLTAKPVVYLVNMSERDYQRKKNKWLPKLFEWVKASVVVLGQVLLWCGGAVRGNCCCGDHWWSLFARPLQFMTCLHGLSPAPQQLAAPVSSRRACVCQS
jgi:hypothetical protein